MTEIFNHPPIIPVILCGGSGSRLWPLSRQKKPKQFLSLVDDKTLFQSTLLRLQGIPNTAPPIIICNEDHRFIAAEQLRQINHTDYTILLEPTGRNTAPAIALGALQAIKNTPQAHLLVLPADHIIDQPEALHQAINHARQLAHENYLVSFGVEPEHPETGYGYIKKGKAIKHNSGSIIERFVEKPDAALAMKYVDSGQYLWNSGMFLFSARDYLQELQKFQPEIYSACQKSLQNTQHDLNFTRIDEQFFSLAPNISIDYAVMEKTKHAAVVPLNAGWRDIGSWDSLVKRSTPDKAGNHFSGDVIAENSSNNYVRAQHKLFALVGVDNLIIIDTPDATLVLRKDQSQNVSKIVNKLKSNNRPEMDNHQKVERPWGSYTCIDSNTGYQVKRLTIHPGGVLSLQRHQHRAEHWIMVKGEADIVCDDKSFTLKENQSTFIARGSTHRLANSSADDIEIIEVQSGHYLGEDDIKRFEDVYGRHID